MNDIVKNLQIAADIHNQTKEIVLNNITENTNINTLCDLIENNIIEKNENLNQLNQGIAFPTGISINNVAAHYTPGKNENYCIKKSDVVKIDYGVHHNGYIIDSAFTVNLDNKYNILYEASKDAVLNVIKNVGVDSKFSELSKIIQETVNSYEIDDKPVKIIDNLYGHNIKQWKIHGGKYLYPTVHQNDEQVVDDNEIMAVEVFTSNGDGVTMLDPFIQHYTHYNLKDNFLDERIPLFTNKRLNLLGILIKNNFKTLPFCPRFLNRKNTKFNTTVSNLQELFINKVVNSYPPLIETNKNSKIAQFENTIFVSEEKKINFNI